MFGWGGGGNKEMKSLVVRESVLTTGHPLETTPPADPGPIVPDVHEPFGVQHFGGPMFALAPDISRSRGDMYYPTRFGYFIDIATTADHPVQAETGGVAGDQFLPDLFFYAHPSGLNVQFPSANLPMHLPLEGVSYDNTQIDEQSYLQMAQAKVQAALRGR